MRLEIRPVCDGDTQELVRITLLAFAPIFASFAQIQGPVIYPMLYPDWRKTQQQAVESMCRHEHGAEVWVAEFEGRAE